MASTLMLSRTLAACIRVCPKAAAPPSALLRQPWLQSLSMSCITQPALRGGLASHGHPPHSMACITWTGSALRCTKDRSSVALLHNDQHCAEPLQAQLFQDPLAAKRKELREKDALVDEVNKQAQELEALKAQLHSLRSKGPNAQTPQQ